MRVLDIAMDSSWRLPLLSTWSVYDERRLMMLMTWRIYPLSNTYEGNIQERPDDAKLYLNNYTNIHTLKPLIFLKLLGLPLQGELLD
jgi:hypothetical protein